MTGKRKASDSSSSEDEISDHVRIPSELKSKKITNKREAYLKWHQALLNERMRELLFCYIILGSWTTSSTSNSTKNVGCEKDCS